MTVWPVREVKAGLDNGLISPQCWVCVFVQQGEGQAQDCAFIYNAVMDCIITIKLLFICLLGPETGVSFDSCGQLMVHFLFIYNFF